MRFWLLCLLIGAGWTGTAKGEIRALPIGSAQAWKLAEFQVEGVPASPNPFDPDQVRVDATIEFPSGKQAVYPAYWHQEYTRSLVDGRERLSVRAAPEWRLRFVPKEAGDYQLRVAVRTNGTLYEVSAPQRVSVAAGPVAPGYVQLQPGGQYFQTEDGAALRLVGHNVCWHHARGTYDYDDWFGAMRVGGENVARLWMWPVSFGLEVEAGSLNRYRLDRAWQLDEVFRIAERNGIYLLLCLDYHGMFEVTPDYWGGNNHWTNHPYNQANGGPCVNQNAFFTDATARAIYQKRLRYLVARYGYSPNLLAWEFFNEIDNVYRYLRPVDVAAWHGVMGNWLKANDPFGHLVSTSLTGNSDRPEIWNTPSLDFSMYHSYNEPGPAGRMAEVAQSFRTRYGKPVLVGEFGLDWRGWNRAGDPYLRGFRQGVWGGALGGSAGTAMAWWWEKIHEENVYPVYRSLQTILGPTGWGRGQWSPIQFATSGPPPSEVGEWVAGEPPFDAWLQPSTAWGAKPTGRLAVAQPWSTAYAPGLLNGFVHGSAHPELRVPFRLSAWLGDQARLVLHLNSVSQGAVLAVRVDGAEVYRTNLPNLDGKHEVNNEYNLDLTVNLPAGKRSIEVLNPGGDWFVLDWVRLERVLPARYAGDWQPSPEAIGLSKPGEALVYVVAPGLSFPGGATNAAPPLQADAFLRLAQWPDGEYIAEWHDPANGNRVGATRSITTNGVLRLPLPPFREDLAGVLLPPPRLEPVPGPGTGTFQFRLQGETGGEYFVETSTNLSTWDALDETPRQTGATVSVVPEGAARERGFFRARKPLAR